MPSFGFSITPEEAEEPPPRRPPSAIRNPAFIGRVLSGGTAGREYLDGIAAWACDPALYQGPLHDAGAVLDAYLDDKELFREHVRFIREGLLENGCINDETERPLVERSIRLALDGWMACAPSRLAEAIKRHLEEVGCR